MKKILFLIFIIIVLLAFYGCKRASDKMFDDCMVAGVQSQEQCEFEAYYR